MQTKIYFLGPQVHAFFSFSKEETSMIDLTPKKLTLAEARKNSSQKYKTKNTIIVKKLSTSSKILESDFLDMLKILKTKIDTLKTFSFLCMLGGFKQDTVSGIYYEIISLKDIFEKRTTTECLTLAKKIATSVSDRFKGDLDISEINEVTEKKLDRGLEYELEKTSNHISDDDLKYEI